ncbi:hypothetical protein [Cellulomonas fimi]|uniref:Uncharacterized protein n=1 Tax=Cellulomonas fimi TaxID=1708 RepID=A0A7Y0M0E8_CELFI|nr:hypothetical protein [Cellulomonas fimi]NMR21230.1 hypothetical protein [Cellulomonas fimi]
MATSDPATWASLTHDWTATVDRRHLDAIRADPRAYAPGGALHLVLDPDLVPSSAMTADLLRRVAVVPWLGGEVGTEQTRRRRAGQGSGPAQ